MVEVRTKTTYAVLRDREEAILNAWMERQLENITLRLDLISKEDLEKQSHEFLQALIKAMSTGNLKDVEAPEYKQVIKMLQKVSSTRATQGFTPSETATYIFSLKDAILQFLQEELAGVPDILNREITVVSQLLDKLGIVTFETYSDAREKVVSEQKVVMIEMATPIMILWKDILLLPIIGTLDSKRAQVIMEEMLKKIAETESKVIILDILGVATVDTGVAGHIVKMTKATRLMGCDCVISGITPEIAQTMVHLGIDLGSVITAAALRDAVMHAFDIRGYELVESKEALKKKMA